MSSFLGPNISSAPCSLSPTILGLPFMWEIKLITHTLQAESYFNWREFSRADRSFKMWRFSRVSWTDSVPIFRVLLGFGRTKTVLVLPNPQQHTLKMGTQLVPQTSENLHILTLLSARYYFTEFCRREKLQDLCILTELHLLQRL